MRRLQSLLILLPVLLLAACAGPQPKGPGAEMGPQASEASAALAAGEYAHAALLFRQLATEAEPPLRQQYLYYAAEAWFKQGVPEQASQDLSAIDPTTADDETVEKAQLLLAELTLRRDPDQALAQLQQLAIPEQRLSAQPDLIARYHQLRAQAYSRTGQHLAAALEYVLREPYLGGDQAGVAENQLAIWQALSKVALDKLTPDDPLLGNVTLKGWVDLMTIARNLQLNSAQVSAKVAEWRKTYPTHPALDDFIRDRIESSRELIGRPPVIALLFSFSGRFGSAAEAVRDGFLAAYYDSPDRDKVTVRMYDIGPDVSKTMEAYQRAVDDGAGIIIGPLDKDAVRQLDLAANLPVTTIALNYVEAPLSKNLYQFTLSPERESRQVAERAWLEGNLRAAVITPEGSLGDRMAKAFTDRWTELGGKVASSITYDSKASDYSLQIRRLLNLDQSRARQDALDRVLGINTEFTPRRRQDIDFIFVVGFPRQVRLMRPQLRFHHATDLPIYSTSYAFSGEVDANKDRDLDGIAFLDMPWTLGAPTPHAKLRQEDKKALAVHAGPLQRLVAMGVDSYTLSGLIRFLEHFPYEYYNGETGKLSVLEDHQVRNKMLWARFVYGTPRLMEELSAGDTSDNELY